MIFNATWDRVEDKFKAAQIGDIKHDANFYEAIYHNQLAHNLKDLGYGVRRKARTFEIAGIGDDLIQKYSRRQATIEATKDKIESLYGTTMGNEAKSKLGATTRLHKVEISGRDLKEYWEKRLTDRDWHHLLNLKGQPSYECSDKKATEHAIGHAFERKAVVDERYVYELSLRHGIGDVTLRSVQNEAKRQGLLVKGDQATTKEVLAQEGRIIEFARKGRGTMRPLKESQPIIESASAARQSEGTGQPEPLTLSPEQQAAIQHVWNSPDQVITIRGGAGTGKTTMMKTAIAGIDKPVVILAPSSDASRGVLRKEGFEEADTLARFLIDEKFQERARGGVIWVDEAGLVGMKQVDSLFKIADELQARVVLQGDPRQHGAIERNGVFKAMQDYAGLPLAELKEIKRQTGSYKDAVKAISERDFLAGYDILDGLGWVKETDTNTELVDDYFAAMKAKKSVLIVSPTHAEGDEITAEIRERLKADGKLGEERQVEVLKNLNWSEADKADLHRFDGTETIVFGQNSGPFRKSGRARVSDVFSPGVHPKAKHYNVYSSKLLDIAVGDQIRVTAGGKTKDGKHRIDNGFTGTVRGFDRDGDITLTNDWVISKDFGHLQHNYVSTSFAAQGKTVDRVLIAMGSESRPAINAEQFYVSASRGRESQDLQRNCPGQLTRSHPEDRHADDGDGADEAEAQSQGPARQADAGHLSGVAPEGRCRYQDANQGEGICLRALRTRIRTSLTISGSRSPL